MPTYNISNLSKNSPTLHALILVSVCNIIALLFLNDLGYRLCRLFTVMAALIYFHFYFEDKRLWTYIVLSAILISDLGMVFYENQAAANLYRYSLIFAFIILNIVVFNKILWKEISLFEYTTYGFMFLFCSFVFDFTVSNIADLFPNFSFMISVYITGGVGLVTCLLFSFYNVVHTSFNSVYITYGVFTLALSNYNALVAYYYQTNATVFYILERTMFIIAMYCILRHVYETQLMKSRVKIDAKISSLDSIGF
jgi:hypothetical protein